MPALRSRVTAGVVALGLLAACCGGAGAPAGTAARCPGRGPAHERLVLWHPFVDDDGQRRALVGALDRFQAEHPGLHVETRAIPMDNLAARLGVAAADDLPDVMLVGEGDLARLADSGRTLPAQSCLEAVGGPAPDAFWPRVRRTWTTRGQLWAVPWAATVPLLWINARLLGEAGVPVPRTRDDLAATLSALQARTGQPAMQYDLELAFVLAERWAAQRGRPLTAWDDGGHATVHLDRPDVRDDLVWLRDLDRRALITSPGGDASPDDVLALAAPTGPTALAVQTSATVNQALARIEHGELDPALGALAPVPSPGAGGGVEPPASGYGLVLVDHPGADPTLAAGLATWLVDPGRQADLAAVSGLIPVRRGTERESALVALVRRYPPLQVALDTIAAPAPVGHDDERHPVRPGTQPELRITVIDAYRRLLDGDDPGRVMADAQRIAARHIQLYEAAHS